MTLTFHLTSTVTGSETDSWHSSYMAIYY